MADINRARALRKRRTWAEKLMWRWLRDRQFSGYKFRREHPLGKCFLDFFCEEARLSIELDGFQEGHPARQAYDAEREKFLVSRGVKTLRFWNRQLRSERQFVRDYIFNALQQRAPHPLPDYTRAGVVVGQRGWPSARANPGGGEPGQGVAGRVFERFDHIRTAWIRLSYARPHPSPLPQERRPSRPLRAARPVWMAATGSIFMQNLFPIIHEDPDLLVINKPAGLVCHPTKTDEYSSLIGRVRLYLGHELRPHLINRLDRETSGVVIVGKNSETAGKLGKIWETRAVCKEYLAIVHGQVLEPHGIIDAPLGKDEQSQVAIKDCVRDDGASARTEFWVESRFFRPRSSTRDPQPFSLLRVIPHTGRKHQIRIHLAHIGHPVVGDKLYGDDEDLYLAFVENRLTDEQRARLILPNHALHARELRLPWRGQQRIFAAEPEPWFTAFACGTLDSDSAQ